MGLRVNEPGLLTTIQDGGRMVGIAAGFSPSGVMDRQAAQLANLLTGHSTNQPVLEYSILGPTITFTAQTVIALTGGRVAAKLNGVVVAQNQALVVHRNDQLVIGPLLSGRYGYLAVANVLKIPKVLESYATSLRYQLGGFKGRALRAGDFIATREPAPTVTGIAQRKISLPAADESQQTQLIRVVPGPQFEQFEQPATALFVSQTYTVSKDADRMGIRLSGVALSVDNVPEMLSEATVAGGIQVPKSGQPIVLMADRQTTGGYPVIAVVATVDLPKLVQIVPGHEIQFEWITLAQSQQLLREQSEEMVALQQRFSHLKPDTTRHISTKIRQLFETN